MYIDYNISEEENLFNEMNEELEFPLEFDNIVFGTPVSNTGTDTSIDIIAKPGQRRYRGTIGTYEYNRIDLKDYINSIDFTKEDNRVVLYINTYLNNTPSNEEIISFFFSKLDVITSSINIELLEYKNNNNDYDTGKVSISSKKDSLIYIGNITLDVVFKPISKFPKVLGSFI